MTVHVFLGPTLSRSAVPPVLAGRPIRAHPPVRHGDLLRLGCAAGDTVLIIDGVFHQSASVRHKEILQLLADGVHVLGASSMGALRAAELHPLGMIGVGHVFDAYRSSTLDADDEVAILQAPGGTDEQVTEALVNIRYCLDAAVTQGVLDRPAADALLADARSIDYAHRSWPALRAVSRRGGHAHLADFERLCAFRLADPQAANIKRVDARHALDVAARLDGTPATPSDWQQTSWRTSHLAYWHSRFAGHYVEGVHLPRLAILQYRQLYDLDFPTAWRQLALSWIAGAPGTGARPAGPAVPEAAAGAPGTDVEDRAIRAAAERGLSLMSLRPEQREHWLTADERSNVPVREQLLRLLVRSARLDSTIGVWPGALDSPALSIDHGSAEARAVAAAFKANDQLRRSGANRTIHHLRLDRLRLHLAQTWRRPPEDRTALQAAARDRGFDSFDGAVEVSRSFYLHARDNDGVVRSATS